MTHPSDQRLASSGKALTGKGTGMSSNGSAERALAGIEAFADAWIAGTEIHKAIAAAAKAAPAPFQDRLASYIYGLVSQAYVEAFYAGFNYHKDGQAARTQGGPDAGL